MPILSKTQDLKSVKKIDSLLSPISSLKGPGNVLPGPVNLDIIEKQKQREKETLDEFHSLNSKRSASIYNLHEITSTLRDGDFKLNDIEEGKKPGIRNGTIVNKGMITDLVTAAAKEGVPLMDALATGLRESGLGHGMAVRGKINPRGVFQMLAWNTGGINGVSMDYDQFRLKNNLVDKKYVSKNNMGYGINSDEPESERSRHYGKYNEYLKSFKEDPSLQEPFRKEMRFLKNNLGQKYNPGEKERSARMAKEKQVILNNPEFYDYAYSAYVGSPKKQRNLTAEKKP